MKLIKFDNLLIIAFAQFCLKYGLFEPFNIPITLNGFGVSLLVLATISIVAAGNIVIAQYDQETSATNNLLYGTIAQKSANTLFIVLNVIGVLIGFYLANLISKPGFVALFIITSGIFYVYATYLKEILVVKNVCIAALAGLCLIVIGIFDLLPAINEENKEFQVVIFSIILDYSIFTFFIIFLRELIKDCIHIDRDHKLDIKTIPIVVGKERSLKLIGLLVLIPIILIFYYIYTYLFSNTTVVVFVLLFVIAPLLYVMIKCFGAATDKLLTRLSLVLKIVLIITAISLVFYQFVL
ncbi:geranylgeranylglycerol-phosphate geranylgeranyltransferase [Aquimarina sp. 2201CG1-2-11]|uniref:geranylgeranylglycerol-phosphate geranylgeranyltransferase n=1 Tax=Aquimarina discodermiae TaxID=3231043 RepID=UPI003462A9D9